MNLPVVNRLEKREKLNDLSQADRLGMDGTGIGHLVPEQVATLAQEAADFPCNLPAKTRIEDGREYGEEGDEVEGCSRERQKLGIAGGILDRAGSQAPGDVQAPRDQIDAVEERWLAPQTCQETEKGA